MHVTRVAGLAAANVLPLNVQVTCQRFSLPNMPLVADQVASPLPSRTVASSAGVSLSLPLMLSALLAVALWLRIWQLGNLPGINADEAWYGVQVNRFLAGEAFTWRTPTGNPINPFFLGPLVLLHALFEPSFVLLRSVALASGLLAIGVNYLLCRRAFDRHTAIASTCLLALLPINIAYSRFAWDASQSLLFTLPVLYCSLTWFQSPHRSALPWAACVALAAAIVVHPTNIFVAPLIAVPVLLTYRESLLHLLRGTRAPAQLAWLAGILLVSLLATYLAWALLAAAIQRVHGPAELAPFAFNYLKLLSGATIYEFIAGTNHASGLLAYLPAACNVAFALLVIAAACGWYQRLSSGAAESDVCLLWSVAAVVTGFVVVAGAHAIAPHFERYGICLVGPGCLVIARGLAWWVEPARRYARLTTWLLAVTTWLLPLSFWLGYFVCLEQTGGLSHAAFRTARLDPKQAAVDWIVEHRDPHEPAQVIVSQWWLYWPLEYLAAGRGNLTVHDSSGRIDPLATPRPPARQAWYVEFADTEPEHRVIELISARGEQLERRVVLDFGQRPVISVLRGLDSAEAK
jgi:hypothetical protein